MAEEKDDKGKDDSSDKGDSKEGQSTEEKLTNLEKKLGDVSKTIDDQNQFINAASVVINTLAYTPELREHFQKVIKSQVAGEGDDKQPTKTEGEDDKAGDDKGKDKEPDDKTTRVVKDVEASQRESIIVQFEKDSGIDQMEPEKQKEARQQVASYLNDFGWSAGSLPLVNLKASLGKAFIGTVGIQKLKEEGKLEGIIASKTNSDGIMGQISGVVPPAEQEADLSPKQKVWVEKLGIDPEKAKKTYLAKEEEEKRVVKTEKKEAE